MVPFQAGEWIKCEGSVVLVQSASICARHGPWIIGEPSAVRYAMPPPMVQYLLSCTKSQPPRPSVAFIREYLSSYNSSRGHFCRVHCGRIIQTRRRTASAEQVAVTHLFSAYHVIACVQLLTNSRNLHLMNCVDAAKGHCHAVLRLDTRGRKSAPVFDPVCLQR